MSRIQWSKLKKMLEDRFCKNLIGRVHIHMARYMSDEEIGRMWIVLDKQQIFSVSDNQSLSQPAWYLKNGCVYHNSRWGRDGVESHLLPYLSLSIEEALNSSNEITKSLAMFDKRVGKRRLKILEEKMEKEALLVKHFYTLRCSAENLHFNKRTFN